MQRYFTKYRKSKPKCMTDEKQAATYALNIQAADNETKKNTDISTLAGQTK
jgi:hypothetical protein